jgi:DNA mismatch endonuclease, patch repair protein
MSSRELGHRTGTQKASEPLRNKAHARSFIMRQVKSQNTGPELQVRRTAHKLGYRFRITSSDLPGSPDLAFPSRCAAVFVHGCFWHGHAGCRYGQLPRTNLTYWEPKIAKNKERDARVVRELAEMGWRTLVLWQCQLDDLEALGRTLQDFLGPASSGLRAGLS